MLRWLLLLNSFDLPLLSIVVPACTSGGGFVEHPAGFGERCSR